MIDALHGERLGDMILSYAHGFVFLKGRKVAGTSLEMALAALCGPRDVITPITPVDERYRLGLGLRPRNFADSETIEQEYIARVLRNDGGKVRDDSWPRWRFFNHMPLREVLERAPESRGMRRVMIERNPYAKVISQAAMLVGLDDYHKTGAMSVNVEDARRKASNMLERGSVKVVRNIPLYEDESGQVDGTVLRYENLEEDFAGFMRSLRVTEPPPLAHAKRSVMSNSIDPRDFFTRAQIDQINRMFHREFKRFGYDKIK